MVVKPLRLISQLVGPYGLFMGGHSGFTVARKVNASSHSSEVLKFLSSASSPRFIAIEDQPCTFTGNSLSDLALGEMSEFAIVEKVNFSYRSGVDEPMSIAGYMFSSVIKAWGGWREFIRDIRGAGGRIELMQYDEDGIDYERLAEYSVRLMLVGGESERLMKSEGLSLWD